MCLPPASLDVEEFLESRDAVVAGWGLTEQNKRAKILQRAPVPYANKEQCEQVYSMALTDGQVS